MSLLKSETKPEPIDLPTFRPFSLALGSDPAPKPVTSPAATPEAIAPCHVKRTINYGISKENKDWPFKETRRQPHQVLCSIGVFMTMY